MNLLFTSIFQHLEADYKLNCTGGATEHSKTLIANSFFSSNHFINIRYTTINMLASATYTIG